MREVAIVGIGQTPVREHWDRSLKQLAVDSILSAMADAKVEKVDALYVGNMLSYELAGQENLGAVIADQAGLYDIEVSKIEAACASGAAALRAGIIAVAGGAQEVVVCCGVEKMTDFLTDTVSQGLATAADWEAETLHGVTFCGLNALLMQRYMYEYKVKHEDFAGFVVNAHQNGISNEMAMYRNPITFEQYNKAVEVTAPITLLDSCPICDGSASVVICPLERAKEFTDKPVKITGSSCAYERVAVAARKDILFFEGVYKSAQKAYQQAGRGPKDINIFEPHDAFTIITALSLEACGFAEKGKAVNLAREGKISLGGELPITTMGGLKSRGHPVGGTGIYQVIEVVQQLKGQAGKNQVKDCSVGMTQSIGGAGTVVVTHILEV